MDSNSIWKIKSWIQQLHPNLTDISYDTDLIEQRLIDSLRFVDLIFLIEELTGQPIEITTVQLTEIRTLRAIEQHFFHNTDTASVL